MTKNEKANLYIWYEKLLDLVDKHPDVESFDSETLVCKFQPKFRQTLINFISEVRKTPESD